MTAGAPSPGVPDDYAQVICGRTAVQDERIRKAFAATPSADPDFLYADVVVALKPEQMLNNTEPSFHAR
jgi:hypothetical protein